MESPRWNIITALVEIDPVNGLRLKRIYELYAYHNHSLDTLIEALANEGIEFC